MNKLKLSTLYVIIYSIPLALLILSFSNIVLAGSNFLVSTGLTFSAVLWFFGFMNYFEKEMNKGLVNTNMRLNFAGVLFINDIAVRNVPVDGRSYMYKKFNSSMTIEEVTNVLVALSQPTRPPVPSPRPSQYPFH